MQLGSVVALRERLPQRGSDPFSAEPFALSTDLEVLRPSPEPERSAHDWHEHFGLAPSPTILSSDSAARRSSSLSTSESVEQISPMNPSGPNKEDRRGRQNERSSRMDSAAGIQVSMSDMDLDAMFNVRSEGDVALGLRY